MPNRPEIETSIAIIAKNEEKNIQHVIPELLDELRRNPIGPHEIFLIDAYSEDNTAAIAEKFKIPVFKEAGGKGIGIRKAIEVARGKYVIFIDADNSHNPAEIMPLIKTIKAKSADLVISSRFIGGSEELGTKSFDNFLRLLGNKLSVAIINLRWRAKLTDTQNGFRIIKRDTALSLNLESESFSVEQEMVIKCLKANKKIAEIPGVERKRLYGASKIRKRTEFWRYLWSIIKNFYG